MSLIRLPLLAAILLAAVLGCEDAPEEPSGPSDSLPPAVTALEPAPGARDVAVTAAITVRFSEPINPATVGPASFLVRQGFDPVVGSYVFGDSSASFVPEASLAFQTSFSVTVTRGIRDPAGNRLLSDTAWGFQTIAQGTPAPPPQ